MVEHPHKCFSLWTLPFLRGYGLYTQGSAFDLGARPLDIYCILRVFQFWIAMTKGVVCKLSLFQLDNIGLIHQGEVSYLGLMWLLEIWDFFHL